MEMNSTKNSSQQKIQSIRHIFQKIIQKTQFLRNQSKLREDDKKVIDGMRKKMILL